MTTTILEPALLERKNKGKPIWWKTIPARLLAWVREFFRRMNSLEPNVDLHERMREYHQSKYMHLIHRI